MIIKIIISSNNIYCDKILAENAYNIEGIDIICQSLQAKSL